MPSQRGRSHEAERGVYIPPVAPVALTSVAYQRSGEPPGATELRSHLSSLFRGDRVVPSGRPIPWAEGAFISLLVRLRGEGLPQLRVSSRDDAEEISWNGPPFVALAIVSKGLEGEVQVEQFIELPTPGANVLVDANDQLIDDDIRVVGVGVRDVDGDGRDEAKLIIRYSTGVLDCPVETSISRLYIVDLGTPMHISLATTVKLAGEDSQRLDSPIVLVDHDGDGHADAEQRRALCLPSSERFNNLARHPALWEPDEGLCETRRVFVHRYDPASDRYLPPEPSLFEGTALLLTKYENAARLRRGGTFIVSCDPRSW